MAREGSEYSDEEMRERITRDLKNAMTSSKDWREESRRAYQFVAGEQYDETDLAVAQEIGRPMIVFNRVAPVLDAVAGMEVGNRHEVRFAPTENTDAGVADLLTEAVRWASTRAEEPQQTSWAFRDMITCGVGVTGARLDYETDPDGKILVDRLDPLGYFWDAGASGRNLLDRRWDAFIKMVDEEELEEQFGEDAVEGLALEDDIWRPFLIEGGTIHNADLSVAYTQGGANSQSGKIPLVEYEYFRREPYYRVNFATGLEDVDAKDFRTIKKDLDAQGIRYVKQMRRRFYRVFLCGNVILEHSPSPCAEHFSRNVMTGKRDEGISGWHGMVRPMIGTVDTQGPQQLANKLYSEAINVIATASKGGLMAETDAFEDIREAEEQWAASDNIIHLRPGGLAKVTPKPLGEYPQGLDRLMEWAVRSVPEVTGVNWELLGLVNRDQPGIVEDSRRQAAVTILAEYFDALKLYRQNLGRLIAYYIREYMAGDTPEDSQLIRLSGQGSEQLVPLLKSQLTYKYDVMVDDSPSSANQKDKTWAVLAELIPMAVQMGMPPPANWIEYAPIPQALAQAWMQSLQPQPQQPDPAMQRLMESEAAKNESGAQLDKAKTQESVAKAAETMAKARLAPQELQLRTFEAAHKAAQQQAPTQQQGEQGNGSARAV